MVKVFVLTSSSIGFASFVLERLIAADVVEIGAVYLNVKVRKSKSGQFRRNLKKIRKIGVLGALNGKRMRKWYHKNVADLLSIKDIESVCKKHDLPFEKVSGINTDNFTMLLKSMNFDLGLCLGNGYISPKVFQIPLFGMINVHHEQLPEYQGAQSVIWQLFNKSVTTAFTIHLLNSKIDQGEILTSRKIPILFEENLGKTVSSTYSKLWTESTMDLIKVLSGLSGYLAKKSRQGKGNYYTTPSFLQFLRILYNHNRLKRKMGK